MSKKISFIHTADLHLDSPFKGLANIPEAIYNEVRESTFVALERIVSTAIDRQVDFVLIVGDLFDNERQSLKAQIRLRRAFEELEKYNIKVYLSYGNHDYINGNIHPVNYPDNVYSFNSEQVNSYIFEKNGEQLVEIQGFSYENRAVLDNKTKEYNKNNTNIPFHIGMLHGSISSNTDHDTYAPFQLKQLLEKDFQYWALGHIHQRQILKKNPFVIYPGNTQGRSRKETGEKGCYHVVLTEIENEITFVPTQAIEFLDLTVDVSLCEQIHDLESKIQAEIQNERIITPQLINLNLTSDNENLTNWKNTFDLEELIEVANERLINQSIWNYIYAFKVTPLTTQFNELNYQTDHFIGELSRQFEEEQIYVYLNDLFNHKQGRKYLKEYSKEKEVLLKDEAKQLLFNELFNSGGDLYQD